MQKLFYEVLILIRLINFRKVLLKRFKYRTSLFEL